MNPKLIEITGPSQGAIFELTGGDISIGREAANRVRIIDPSVSRRHSLIEQEGEKFKIRDLDSFNGTFVNGTPVTERFLEHGDHVAVGNVVLLFVTDEAEGEGLPSPVSFDEGNLVTQSTAQLRVQDVFYLQPEKVLSALPPTARVARDLNTLLQISMAVNSIHSLEKFQRRLLELILEIVPAERGAVLLVDERSGELVPSVSFSRLSAGDETVCVSRTVVMRAIRESAAILSNDVSAGAPPDPAGSLAAPGVRALLCAPLILLEKCIGVIYLDTHDAATTFNDHHLQLLTAIAAVAVIAIENLQRVERLEGENQRLSKEVSIRHKMVGESLRMRDFYQFVAKVAPAEVTVLIRGESGTGKELAARALHANSPRARKPFVAINCATLTEMLLESELFGHEKGAFTGAIALKRGKLEIADGGTLFLDEVGELALNIQAKLLRVLQEREFERVGGTRTLRVDIRVIAATNKDLAEAVRGGAFREDLYYRLNVISFTMPPLRERREDIPLLASYFAAECSKRAKRKTAHISAEARSYLQSYDWPGNVRELENAIEHAVVLGSTERILPEDLPETILETAISAGAPVAKFYDAIRETKRRLLLDAIQQAHGNYTEAAKLLGIHPNNLHRLVRSMDLKRSLGK
ncbi:MAG TPA: sigma 54-interacting transcriptional regulator [Pyrinomonadaceae bacterium]|nr:sigma 54-interacting transcriptional regulator [Pyrinomonadaceae bacterium]